MKKDDYIHIKGWMISDLNLKGNELLIYAIVHGYSKDGMNHYRGSITYVMNFLKISNRCVINCFTSLVQKGLILKEQKNTGNLYRVTELRGSEQSSLVNNVHIASEQSSLLSREQSSHNSNNYNNHKSYNKSRKLKFSDPIKKVQGNIDIQNGETTSKIPLEKKEKKPAEKKKKEFSPEVLKCYENCITYFSAHLIPKDNFKWLDDIDKLNRIDGIPFNFIENIVMWARGHTFWGGNFLSILKLRKKNKEGIPYVVIFSEQMNNKKTKHDETRQKRITNDARAFGFDPSELGAS